MTLHFKAGGGAEAVFVGALHGEVLRGTFYSGADPEYSIVFARPDAGMESGRTAFDSVWDAAP